MATNDKIIRKSVPLSSADFDTIKTSLKTFLQQRPELADYDFDGSSTNVLLDLLSYNSHVNAFFLNMVGNEAFLKAAVRRASVVARAEANGYNAKSMRSASTTLYVKLVPTTPAVFIPIPKYTVFPASANGISFNFYTLDDVQLYPDTNGDYVYADLPVFEGKFLTHKFVVDQLAIDQGVVIPNVNVDNTLLRVSIAESTTSTNFVEYKQIENIVDVTPNSPVYFVRENEGFVNVYFGDGTLGLPLVLGSVVEIIYPISSGDAANGITKFTLGSSLDNVTSSVVIATSSTYGGAQAESIESIKLNAPQSYQTQNRALCAQDYTTIVKQFYANAQDVIAWGGEDNIPPAYGKVFVSIKPHSGYYMTKAEKNVVYTLLKKKNVAGITPSIVDADYIFLNLNVVFDYNKDQTNLGAGELQTMVGTRIFAYSESSLSRFDAVMRKSVISRIIDNSDPSIISNTFKTTMEKRLFPTLGVSNGISLLYNNQVVPGTLVSTTFTFNNNPACYFADNGNGVVGIFALVSSVVKTISANAGTIDYTNGQVTLNNITISDINNAATQQDIQTGAYFMSFAASPVNDDISPTGQQIVEIATVVAVGKLPNSSFIG